VSILIENARYVVTMDPERRILRECSIVVEGDRISFVGPSAEARLKFGKNFDEVIDAKNMVALPGFVDTHVHLQEHLTRGFFPEGLSTRDFVFKYELPFVAELTAEEESLSAAAACVDMIKTGTTCFCDIGVFHVDEVIERLERLGIRGTTGRGYFVDKETGETPAEWKQEWRKKLYASSAEEVLKSIENILYRHRQVSNGRIKTWVTLEGIGTCSDELYLGAKRLAYDHGVGIYHHIASSLEEVKASEKETGEWPISHLSRIGMLCERQLVVHAVLVKDEEVGMLAKHGVKVAHCPGTALRIAKGVTKWGKFPEMLEQGVTVGLGSDGAASGVGFDMTRPMFLAAGLYRDCRLNAKIIPAQTALEMATVNGAKAMLWDKEIGSIETGKKADLILFNLKRIEWVPVGDVVSNLVWSTTGDSVDSAIVDGRVLMRERKLQTTDEEEIVSKADATAFRVAERVGIKSVNT